MYGNQKDGFLIAGKSISVTIVDIILEHKRIFSFQAHSIRAIKFKRPQNKHFLLVSVYFLCLCPQGHNIVLR